MSTDSPRQVRRREKLRALLGNNQGAAAELAAAIGTPKSHISAILHATRGIGDALAAKLERHYEKPPGWLDEPAAAWPFSSDLLDRVAKLDATELRYMEIAMWGQLREDVPESVAKMQKGGLAELGSGVKRVTSEPKGKRTG